MLQKYTAQQLCSGCSVTLPQGTALLRAAQKENALCLSVQLMYRGVYGLGEKFNGINQKGRTAVNRVEEQFCNQGEKTYCPIPFFVTDSGFALFADTVAVTRFCFEEESIQVECPADAELWLGGGTPAELIGQFMQRTGPAALPPKWAFAPWISANHWNTQAQVEQQIQDLARYGYPAATLVVEAWSDEATFYIFNGAQYVPKPNGGALTAADFDFTQSAFWPDPQAMIDRLHAAGLHLVLWQVPVYKKQGAEEAPCPQNDLDRADAEARGLCVRNADGTPYSIPAGHWFAGSMIPDFTNPKTRRAWFEKRRYLLEMGVDGFKTDGGEFVCSPDARFYDGTTGAEQQNRYAQSYTEAYIDFLDQSKVLFSRAGYIGQQKTPCLWGGDHQSTNEELYSVLSAGLSAAMSGIPFWGFDIAGFAGSLPTLDLYRRSTMFACFCPIMQWHSEPDGGQFRELMPGGEGNNERSPWNLAKAWNMPSFTDEMRFWHRLRMNLLPYLYAAALDCAAQNRPMMRPLVYLWPEDGEAIAAEDEYLLGDSLLVAPLLEENQMERTVYLPEGNWYGLFDRRRYSGKRRLASSRGQPFPVYLREGFALPLFLDGGTALGCDVGNSSAAGRPLHFLLAGPKGEGHFLDEGANDFTFKWEAGEVRVTGKKTSPLTWEILSAAE